MKCFTCKSLSGERIISPGPTIYESKYWVVEHAYPTGLKGWVVMVLKRHCKALHELSGEEFSELGDISYKIIGALRQVTHCEKEYFICTAEKEHFNHIHFHIVPRPEDISEELKGTSIFSLLAVNKNNAVPEIEVIEVCNELKAKIPQ